MKDIKYKTYVKYKCGCSVEIPKYGLTGGSRCPVHRELLDNIKKTFYRKKLISK